MEEQETEQQKKSRELSTMIVNQRQAERDALTHIGQMNTGWMNVWKVRSKMIWGAIGTTAGVVLVGGLLYVFIKFVLNF